MVRGRGARSILGSLPAYGWAALALVAALSLAVLWGGPDAAVSRVRLTGGGPWHTASLQDDALRLHVLRAGEERELPPGAYRVTLFAHDGAEAHREVQLVAGEVELDAR